MKPSLLAFLAASGGIVLTACDRKQEAVSSAPAPEKQPAPAVMPPATPPAPAVPAGPSAKEVDLEKQIRALQVKQDEQQRMLDEQKLAQLEQEIAHERALLDKERQAWLLEQQLKEAKNAPLPEPPKSSGSPRTPRTEPVAYAPGPRYDFQHFYDDLTPHGSWFETSSYGYVWRPSCSVSNVSWRPYTSGRWAYCDAGWTWMSDEPFGWACYHYGRWAWINNCGWVWIPGDQWAPAWVSWRRSNDYVGWCPLPPETLYDRDCTYGSSIDTDYGIHPRCYVFVPSNQFDRPVLNHCLAPLTCVNLVRLTVNCTNFIISVGGVQCHGPRHDWLVSCVHREIPRLRLDCYGERPSGGFAGFRDMVENDRIRCYAPGVRAPWNQGLRPHRMEAKIEAPEVLRADKGLSPKYARRFAAARQEQQEASEKALKSEAGRKVAERQGRVSGMTARLEELREIREKRSAPAEPVVTAKSPAGENIASGTRSEPGSIAGSRRDLPPGGKSKGREVPASPSSTEAAGGAPVAPAEQELAKTREEMSARQAMLEQLRKQRGTQEAVAGGSTESRNTGERTKTPPVTVADRISAAKEERAKAEEAARVATEKPASAPDAAGRGKGEPRTSESGSAQDRIAAAREERAKLEAERKAATEAAQAEAAAQKAAEERTKSDQSRSMQDRIAAAREERAKLEEQRKAATEAVQAEAARKASEERTKSDEARSMQDRIAAAREERAKLEEQRKAANEAAQAEAARKAAEERTKSDQARSMQDRIAAAREERAKLEEQRKAATEAAQAEAAAQKAAESRSNEENAKARTMAERVAAAQEERRQMEEQRRAVADQQDRAREAAKEAASRDRAAASQEAAAMRAREEAAARQEQAQQEARREAMDRARAEQETRQREAQERAREEQEARQREAQERARQEAMERAREEQEARQREAQERARQEAMERARAEQEARQREAEERARQQQEAAERARAQQEAAERARHEQEAAERAKNGK